MPTKPKPQPRPWVPERLPGNKMENRVRSADEYHTSRWTKESRAFREANPLCKICESKGIVRASEVVDHVVPFPVCRNFWDKTNWQAICKNCNIEKGNKDKKLINGRGNNKNYR